MGNGSSKPGDAKADRWRDIFDRNRAARKRSRASLDSLPDDDPDAEDTQRIKALMADSKSPLPARGFVVVLSVFRSDWARLGALIVLVVLVLALVALGAAKLMVG